MESGISTTKPIDPSITIAMVAPMQSLSTSTSVSSVDSSSQSLSQSQMSSHSNSSEASVILAKGLQHQLLQQKQNIANSPMKNGANSTATGLASSNATSSMTIAQTHSVSAATNNKSEGRELIITDESGPSTKVSPMSVFGGSGSSSMGSLNKCALESSSGASSAGDLGSSGELRSGSSGASSNRPSVGGLSPNNGNNEAIPECDEDDLLLNVTPMEPMTYEYIKSPPSGHQTPGFLSPKSSSGVSGGGIHLGRIGMFRIFSLRVSSSETLRFSLALCFSIRDRIWNQMNCCIGKCTAFSWAGKECLGFRGREEESSNPITPSFLFLPCYLLTYIRRGFSRAFFQKDAQIKPRWHFSVFVVSDTITFAQMVYMCSLLPLLFSSSWGSTYLPMAVFGWENIESFMDQN